MVLNHLSVTGTEKKSKITMMRVGRLAGGPFSSLLAMGKKLFPNLAVHILKLLYLLPDRKGEKPE